jgi:hypothetical protein
VILRNLSINGAGVTLGTNSIRFLDGAALQLENVNIFNFSGNGIDIAQTQSATVSFKNVSISNGGVGIKSTTTVGNVNGTMDDIRITGMSSHGVEAVSSTVLTAQNLNVSRNGGDGVGTDAASVQLAILGAVVHGNATGFNAVAGTIRIHDTTMLFNNVNVNGNVSSDGTNRSTGNTTTNVPNPGAFTVN